MAPPRPLQQPATKIFPSAQPNANRPAVLRSNRFRKAKRRTNLPLWAGAAVAPAGLLQPILLGPVVETRAVATKAELDIGACQIVDAAHRLEAAARTVALVRSGETSLIMIGSLQTDELMHVVAHSEPGLRIERRLSLIVLETASVGAV